MRLVTFAAFLSIVLVAPAFGADPQQPATPSVGATLDAKSILPATDFSSSPTKGNTVFCLRLRTYRVRKDLDRKSLIPATPDEVTFDPDSIVGYTTCQRAEKFDLRKTH